MPNAKKGTVPARKSGRITKKKEVYIEDDDDDLIIVDEVIPPKRNLRTSRHESHDGRKSGSRRGGRGELELQMECEEEDLSPAQLKAIELAKEEHEKANSFIKAARAGNILVPSSQPNTFTVVAPTPRQAGLETTTTTTPAKEQQPAKQPSPETEIASPGLPPPRPAHFMNKHSKAAKPTVAIPPPAPMAPSAPVNPPAPVADVIVIGESPPRAAPFPAKPTVSSPPMLRPPVQQAMIGATPQQVYKFVSLPGSQPVKTIGNQWVIRPLLTVSPQQQPMFTTTTAMAQSVRPVSLVNYIGGAPIQQPALVSGCYMILLNESTRDKPYYSPSVYTSQLSTPGIEEICYRLHIDSLIQSPQLTAVATFISTSNTSDSTRSIIDSESTLDQKLCSLEEIPNLSNNGRIIPMQGACKFFRRTLSNKVLTYKTESHACLLTEVFSTNSVLCLYCTTQRRLHSLKRLIKYCQRKVRQKLRRYSRLKNRLVKETELCGESQTLHCESTIELRRSCRLQDSSSKSTELYGETQTSRNEHCDRISADVQDSLETDIPLASSQHTVYKPNCDKLNSPSLVKPSVKNGVHKKIDKFECLKDSYNNDGNESSEYEMEDLEDRSEMRGAENDVDFLDDCLTMNCDYTNPRDMLIDIFDSDMITASHTEEMVHFDSLKNKEMGNRDEHKNVLSAYEFHRHLEPTCTHSLRTCVKCKCDIPQDNCKKCFKWTQDGSNTSFSAFADSNNDKTKSCFEQTQKNDGSNETSVKPHNVKSQRSIKERTKCKSHFEDFPKSTREILSGTTLPQSVYRCDIIVCPLVGMEQSRFPWQTRQPLVDTTALNNSTVELSDPALVNTYNNNNNQIPKLQQLSGTRSQVHEYENDLFNTARDSPDESDTDFIVIPALSDCVEEYNQAASVEAADEIDGNKTESNEKMVENESEEHDEMLYRMEKEQVTNVNSKYSVDSFVDNTGIKITHRNAEKVSSEIDRKTAIDIYNTDSIPLNNDGLVLSNDVTTALLAVMKTSIDENGYKSLSTTEKAALVSIVSSVPLSRLRVILDIPMDEQLTMRHILNNLSYLMETCFTNIPDGKNDEDLYQENKDGSNMIDTPSKFQESFGECNKALNAYEIHRRLQPSYALDTEPDMESEGNQYENRHRESIDIMYEVMQIHKALNSLNSNQQENCKYSNTNLDRHSPNGLVDRDDKDLYRLSNRLVDRSDSEINRLSNGQIDREVVETETSGFSVLTATERTRMDSDKSPSLIDVYSNRQRDCEEMDPEINGPSNQTDSDKHRRESEMGTNVSSTHELTRNPLMPIPRVIRNDSCKRTIVLKAGLNPDTKISPLTVVNGKNSEACGISLPISAQKTRIDSETSAFSVPTVLIIQKPRDESETSAFSAPTVIEKSRTDSGTSAFSAPTIILKHRMSSETRAIPEATVLPTVVTDGIKDDVLDTIHKEVFIKSSCSFSEVQSSDDTSVEKELRDLPETGRSLSSLSTSSIEDSTYKEGFRENRAIHNDSPSSVHSTVDTDSYQIPERSHSSLSTFSIEDVTDKEECTAVQNESAHLVCSTVDAESSPITGESYSSLITNLIEKNMDEEGCSRDAEVHNSSFSSVHSTVDNDSFQIPERSHSSLSTISMEDSSDKEKCRENTEENNISASSECSTVDANSSPISGKSYSSLLTCLLEQNMDKEECTQDALEQKCSESSIHSKDERSAQDRCTSLGEEHIGLASATHSKDDSMDQEEYTEESGVLNKSAGSDKRECTAEENDSDLEERRLVIDMNTDQSDDSFSRYQTGKTSNYLTLNEVSRVLTYDGDVRQKNEVKSDQEREKKISSLGKKDNLVETEDRKQNSSCYGTIAEEGTDNGNKTDTAKLVEMVFSEHDYCKGAYSSRFCVERESSLCDENYSPDIENQENSCDVAVGTENQDSNKVDKSNSTRMLTRSRGKRNKVLSAHRHLEPCCTQPVSRDRKSSVDDSTEDNRTLEDGEQKEFTEEEKDTIRKVCHAHGKAFAARTFHLTEAYLEQILRDQTYSSALNGSKVYRYYLGRLCSEIGIDAVHQQCGVSKNVLRQLKSHYEKRNGKSPTKKQGIQQFKSIFRRGERILKIKLVHMALRNGQSAVRQAYNIAGASLKKWVKDLKNEILPSYEFTDEELQKLIVYSELRNKIKEKKKIIENEKKREKRQKMKESREDLSYSRSSSESNTTSENVTPTQESYYSENGKQANTEMLNRTVDDSILSQSQMKSGQYQTNDLFNRDRSFTLDDDGSLVENHGSQVYNTSGRFIPIDGQMFKVLPRFSPIDGQMVNTSLRISPINGQMFNISRKFSPIGSQTFNTSSRIGPKDGPKMAEKNIVDTSGASRSSTPLPLVRPIEIKQEPFDEELERIHSSYLQSFQAVRVQPLEDIGRAVDRPNSNVGFHPIPLNNLGLGDTPAGVTNSNNTSTASSQQPVCPEQTTSVYGQQQMQQSSDNVPLFANFFPAGTLTPVYNAGGYRLTPSPVVEKKQETSKTPTPDQTNSDAPEKSRASTPSSESTETGSSRPSSSASSESLTPPLSAFHVSDYDVEQAKALRETLLLLKNRRSVAEPRPASSTSTDSTPSINLTTAKPNPPTLDRIDSLIKSVSTRVSSHNEYDGKRTKETTPDYKSDHSYTSPEKKESPQSQGRSSPRVQVIHNSPTKYTGLSPKRPARGMNTPIIMRSRKFADGSSRVTFTMMKKDANTDQSKSLTTTAATSNEDHIDTLAESAVTKQALQSSSTTQTKLHTPKPTREAVNDSVNLSDKLKSILQADIFNIVDLEDKQKSSSTEEEDWIELLASSAKTTETDDKTNGKTDDRTDDKTDDKTESTVPGDDHSKTATGPKQTSSEDVEQLTPRRRLLYSLNLKQKIGKLANKKGTVFISKMYNIPQKSVTTWKSIYQDIELPDLAFTKAEEEELRIIKELKPSPAKSNEYQIYIDNPEPDVDLTLATSEDEESPVLPDTDDSVKIMDVEDPIAEASKLLYKEPDNVGQGRQQTEQYKPSNSQSEGLRKESSDVPLYISASESALRAVRERFRQKLKGKESLQSQFKSGGVFTETSNNGAPQSAISQPADKHEIYHQPVTKRRTNSQEGDTSTCYLCPIDGVFKFRMPSGPSQRNQTNQQTLASPQKQSSQKTNAQQQKEESPKSKSKFYSEKSREFKWKIVQRGRESGFENAARWYQISVTDLLKWDDDFHREEFNKMKASVCAHALKHGVISAANKFSITNAKVVECLNMEIMPNNQDSVEKDTESKQSVETGEENVSSAVIEIVNDTANEEMIFEDNADDGRASPETPMQPKRIQKRGIAFDMITAKEGRILKPRFNITENSPTTQAMPQGQQKSRMGPNSTSFTPSSSARPYQNVLQNELQADMGIMPRLKQTGSEVEIASTWKQVQSCLNPVKPAEKKYSQEYKNRIIRECELRGQKVVSMENRIPYNEVSRWRLEAKKLTGMSMKNKPVPSNMSSSSAYTKPTSHTAKPPTHTIIHDKPEKLHQDVTKPRENESLKIKIKLAKTPEIIESSHLEKPDKSVKKHVPDREVTPKKAVDCAKVMDKPVAHKESTETLRKTGPVAVNDSENDFRIEVVNYCIQHGVFKTQKHFKVTRQSIIDLMTEYDELNRYAYTAATLRENTPSLKTKLVSREKTSVEDGTQEPVFVTNLQDYIVTTEYKQNVAEYAEVHGITAATRKFKRKASTVKSWMGQFNKKVPDITQSPKVTVSAFQLKVVEYAKVMGISAAAKKWKRSSTKVKSWMGHHAKTLREQKKFDDEQSETQDSPLKLVITEASQDTSQKPQVITSPVWDQDFIIKPNTKSPLKLTLSPRRKSPVISIISDDVNDIETEDECEAGTDDFEEVATWDLEIDKENKPKSTVDENEIIEINNERKETDVAQNHSVQSTEKDNFPNEKLVEVETIKEKQDPKSVNDEPCLSDSVKGLVDEIVDRLMEQDDQDPKQNSNETDEKEWSVIKITDDVVSSKEDENNEIETRENTNEDPIEDNANDDVILLDEEPESSVVNEEDEISTSMEVEEEEIEKIPFEKTIMFQLQNNDIDSFFSDVNPFQLTAKDSPVKEKKPSPKKPKRGRGADFEIMKNIEETCLFSPDRHRRNYESSDAHKSADVDKKKGNSQNASIKQSNKDKETKLDQTNITINLNDTDIKDLGANIKECSVQLVRKSPQPLSIEDKKAIENDESNSIEDKMESEDKKSVSIEDEKKNEQGADSKEDKQKDEDNAIVETDKESSTENKEESGEGLAQSAGQTNLEKKEEKVETQANVGRSLFDFLSFNDMAEKSENQLSIAEQKNDKPSVPTIDSKDKLDTTPDLLAIDEKKDTQSSAVKPAEAKTPQEASRSLFDNLMKNLKFPLMTMTKTPVIPVSKDVTPSVKPDVEASSTSGIVTGFTGNKTEDIIVEEEKVDKSEVNKSDIIVEDEKADKSEIGKPNSIVEEENVDKSETSKTDLIEEEKSEKETKTKERSERNLFDFLSPEPSVQPVVEKPVEKEDKSKTESPVKQSPISLFKLPGAGLGRKPMFKFPKLQIPVNFGSIAKLGMAKMKDDKIKATQKQTEDVSSSTKDQPITLENKSPDKVVDNSPKDSRSETSTEHVSSSTALDHKEEIFTEVINVSKETKSNENSETNSHMEKQGVVMETFEELRKRLAEERAKKHDLEKIEIDKSACDTKIVKDSQTAQEKSPTAFDKEPLTACDKEPPKASDKVIPEETIDYEMYKEFTPQKIVLILDISKKHGIEFASTSFDLPPSVIVNWIIEKDRKHRKIGATFALEAKLLAVQKLHQENADINVIAEENETSVSTIQSWDEQVKWLLDSKYVVDVLNKWQNIQSVTSLQDNGKSAVTDCDNSAPSASTPEEIKGGNESTEGDEIDGNTIAVESTDTDQKAEKADVCVEDGQKNENEAKPEEIVDKQVEEAPIHELPKVLNFVQEALPRDFTIEQKAMIVLLMDKFGLKEVHRKLGINKGTLWTWKNQNKMVKQFLLEQSTGERKRKINVDYTDSDKHTKTTSSPKVKYRSAAAKARSAVSDAVPASETVDLTDAIGQSEDETEDASSMPTGYRYISPTKLPSSLKDTFKRPTREYSLEQRVAIVKLVELYGVRTVHKQFRIPCGSIWNWQHRDSVIKEMRKVESKEETGSNASKTAKCLSFNGDENRSDPFTIDLIMDRAMVAIENTRHVKLKNSQRADIVCMIHYFGIDYVCEKFPSIPRGTMWNWCHNNKNVQELVEKNMQLLKKFDELMGKKGRFGEEETVDKVLMTQQWLNSCQGTVLGSKRRSQMFAGEGGPSIKRSKTSNKSPEDPIDVDAADTTVGSEYSSSGRKSRKDGVMNLDGTQRDSSSDSSVSSISGHSNGFEEIVSDDEANAPSVYSRRSGASGRISLTSKDSSSAKAARGMNKSPKPHRPGSSPGSSSMSVEGVEKEEIPELEVLRIEQGGFNRLMVLYREIWKGSGKDSNVPPAGTKRPSTDSPSSLPPPKKKTTSSKKDDFGETDSSGNWLPLDEYYYGTMEGDLTYAEDKGEFRFKCWYCSKMLYNNVRAMQHIQGHIDSSKQQNIELSDLTQCKHCYKQFDTPFEMQTHVEKVHLSNKVLMCRICEKDFPSPKDLIQHMRMNHSASEMPYVCQLCNFRSSMYSDVVDHFKKKHDSSNKLLCLYCLRAFDVKFVSQGWGQTQTYYGHLMKHQAKTSTKKCQTCRLTFFNAFDIKNHRKSNHGSNHTGVQGLSKDKLSSQSPVMIKMPGGSQKKGQKIKSLNAPSMSKIQDYGDVQMPGATRTSYCIECKMTMSSTDHYKKHINCSLCRFATSCSVAYANHMMGFHSGQMSSLNLNIPWERPQPAMLYCACGFFTKYGNKIANHLVFCCKQTCYSHKPLTTSPLSSKDASQSKGDKKSEGSLLGMLGLVQKKSVATKVRTAQTVAKAKKEEELSLSSATTSTEAAETTKLEAKKDSPDSKLKTGKPLDGPIVLLDKVKADVPTVILKSDDKSVKPDETKAEEAKSESETKPEKQESCDETVKETEKETEDESEKDTTNIDDVDIKESSESPTESKEDKQTTSDEETKSKSETDDKKEEQSKSEESVEKADKDKKIAEDASDDLDLDSEIKEADDTTTADAETKDDSADVDKDNEKDTEDISEANEEGTDDKKEDEESTEETCEPEKEESMADIEAEEDIVENESENKSPENSQAETSKTSEMEEDKSESPEEKKDMTEADPSAHPEDDQNIEDIIETEEKTEEQTTEMEQEEESSEVEKEKDITETEERKEKSEPEKEKSDTEMDKDTTEADKEISEMDTDILDTDMACSAETDEKSESKKEKASASKDETGSATEKSTGENKESKSDQAESSTSRDEKSRSEQTDEASRHGNRPDSSRSDRDRYHHDDRSRDRDREGHHHGDRHSSHRSDSYRDRSHDRDYDRDRSHDRSYDRDRSRSSDDYRSHDRGYDRDRAGRDGYRHGQDNRGQGYHNQRGRGGYQGNQDRHRDQNRDYNNRNYGNRGGGYHGQYRGGYRGGYY